MNEEGGAFRRFQKWARDAMILVLGVCALAYIIVAPRARQTLGAPERIDRGGVVSAETRSLRIGWTAWADAEFVTSLVQRVLVERMDYDVDLIMADIGIQYQGVADGSLDLMLMAWGPTTHADYWERVEGRVVDLGPIYIGGRLGWVVPASVPLEELGTIEDLKNKAVADRLRNTIHGIDPGSGLMQASKRALEQYRLSDVDLLASSASAMAAALERAIRREEWIVVTAWSPHWIFSKWDLRYLEDPKQAMGGVERIHAFARLGFEDDFSVELIEFLARLYIPIEELEEALLIASESSVDRAVDDYLATRGGRVDYWVTGELPVALSHGESR